MATVKFFTKTKAKGGKLVSVFCRLRAGREIDVTTVSGIEVYPEHWSNKSQTVKNIVEADYKDQTNDKLLDLKKHILRELRETDRETITKDWLTVTIDKFSNPDKYKEKDKSLFAFISDFIDKAPTRINPKTNRPVCYKMVREYERTFHYLKDFAKKKRREIDFKDIDLDFYHDFVVYLQKDRTIKAIENGKTVTKTEPGLATNTIGKKIQTLKIFLNAATDAGLNNYTKFKSSRFKAVTEETESIYLTEQEIQRIYDLDFNQNPRLDKVRDLFIIGCWTGLRFSDWNKIKPENIENGFLTLKQSKTGGAVVIPLHEMVLGILEKYDNELPPVLTNQKYNDYLKEVAQAANLTEKVQKTITKGGVTRTTTYEKWQLVSTHTGRRSFATNLYKAGLPSYSIMQVTGHKTEAAFLKYIKVTPREHAEKLKEFWQNRPVMRVVNQ